MMLGVPRIGATQSPRAVRGMLMVACTWAVGLSSACSDDPVPIPSDARPVDLAAFSEGPTGGLTGPRPEVVEVPAAETADPKVEVSSESFPVESGATVTRTTKTTSGLNPATQRDEILTTERTVASMRVGQPWPVESLVGQINGRPIYADEFLERIEDRLIQLSVDKNKSPMEIRAAARELVNERFRTLVDSELVIAEAQSRVSPEMQQGVLAWLRDMQERTVAQHGGSFNETNKQLLEETGKTINEWVEDKKNEALATDLIRRKVEPRVIVSWRDIEQAYEVYRQNAKVEAKYQLGRISLQKDSQADKIELVTKMLAEGKPFVEVAKAVGMRGDGEWREVSVGPNGPQYGDMVEEIAEVLRPLKPGQVSAPVEGRTTMVWYAVVSETGRQEAMSLFDPLVQFGLRDQLTGRRRNFEQYRYISKLRSRWLSKEIGEMRDRLWNLAQERYFGGR
jgi:hypothetical protein